MSIQFVNYQNIDEFLDDLSQLDRAMVLHLRNIIFNIIPNITEKLSYNVLFYKLRKNICFIWPGSVLWGKKQIYQGVRFGFSQGYLLEDPEGYLDKGNRKHVYTKDFIKFDDIDEHRIRYFLEQASRIDG